MESDREKEELVKRLVDLEIENKGLRDVAEKYRFEHQLEGLRNLDITEEKIQSWQDEGAAQRMYQKRMFVSQLASTCIAAVICFGFLLMIIPIYSYLSSLADIKQADLSVKILELKSSGIQSENISTAIESKSHGWVQGLWAITRDWLFPIVIWLALIGVIIVFSFSLYSKYASTSRLAAPGVLSALLSFSGFVFTAVKYREELLVNPAVDYVLYSSFFCVVFVVLLLSLSLRWALTSSLIGVVSLLIASQMRGGILVSINEFKQFLESSSTANAAFLLIATVIPIVLMLALSAYALLTMRKASVSDQ